MPLPAIYVEASGKLKACTLVAVKDDVAKVRYAHAGQALVNYIAVHEFIPQPLT